jgi:hypothetical protein
MKGVIIMSYWGFDTASAVDSDLINCLAVSGAPANQIGFILRYIDARDGVHAALTKPEASYIHCLGISIGLIYGSVPHSLLGFNEGAQAANQASALAQALGVPTYVGIYADLGTSYDSYVTAGFMMGWAWQLSVNTPYHPGFYGNVGTDPDFDSAFAEACGDPDYGYYVTQSLLWSSEPEPSGCTGISGMPAYRPNEPPESGYGQPPVWQYAENCGCTIDEDQSTLAPGNYRWWHP